MPTRSSNPTPIGETSLHDYRELYAAFLNLCPEIPTSLMGLLAQWGLNRNATQRFKLRHHSPNYHQILMKLQEQFSVRVLQRSGLLVSVPNQAGSTAQTFAGCFDAYHAAGIPYLLIPYLHGGQPFYITAKPLVDSTTLRNKRLPGSLATAPSPPTWFNLDTLAEPGQVVILRRELDAIALVVREIRAVACGNFQNITRNWIRHLAGRQAILVVDEARSNDPHISDFLLMFDENQTARPRVLVVPKGLGGRNLALHVAARLEEDTLLRQPEVHNDETRVIPHNIDLDTLDDDLDDADNTSPTVVSPPSFAVENDETRLLPQAQLNESLDSTSAVDVSNLDDGGHEPDTWEATEAGDAEWDQQLASRGHATDESASGEDLSHLFDISGEGQDGFIAAIPVFRERYLTIHVTEDELGEQVVFRYWDQDDEGEWQAEPETFQVPRSRLHDVMSALIAAGAGQSTTERPPWFNPDPEPGRREDSDDEP